MTSQRETRLQPVRNIPSNNGDDGILFVKPITGNPELFFVTTDGGVVQLTSIGSLYGTLPSISSSTDNAIVRWDGTDGSTLQDSNVLIDDSDNISGAQSIAIGDTPASTGAIRLSNSTQINFRNSTDSADIVLGIATSSNNLVLGSVANAGSTYIDAGSAQSVNIRPNAAAQDISFNSTSITTSIPAFRFNTNVATPSIYQVDDNTPSIAGDTLTIHAQDMTGGSGTTGGTLVLQAGNGDTFGTVDIKDGGGTTRIQVTSNGIVGLGSGNPVTVSSATLSLNLTTGIVFASSMVTPEIYQATDTTGSATGDELAIHAQDCSGTTSTGGDLWLRSGDGTTDCGLVLLTSGSQAVSTTRARVCIFYDESASDILWLGGTGPSAAYSEASSTAISATNNAYMYTGGIPRLRVNSTQMQVTPPEVVWLTGTISPSIYQLDDTIASHTGDTFTIHAQDTTGSNSTGGDLVLRAGTGTISNGTLELQDGYGTPIITITPGGDISFDPLTEIAIAGGISATDYIAVGTDPAQSDVIRIPYDSAIMHRNSTNDGDRRLIGVTGSAISIGEDSPNGETNLYIIAQSGVHIVATGLARASFTSTKLSLLAINAEFSTATVSPIIYQADDTTGSITGDTFTIHAQDATGATSTGGDLHLRPGTGTSVDGELELQDADGTARVRITSSHLVDIAGNINVAASSASIAGASVAWTAAAVSPILFQSDDVSASATGDTLTIHAQDATGTTSTGGGLTLRPGSGTSANGSLILQDGSANAMFTISATSNLIFSPSSLVQFNLGGSNTMNMTASALSFGPDVTNPSFYQGTDTNNGITGDTLTIHAQDASGTTTTGGGLTLRSGTGTTTDGEVKISRGTTISILGTSSSQVTIGGIAGAGTRPAAVELDGSSTVRFRINGGLYYDLNGTRMQFTAPHIEFATGAVSPLIFQADDTGVSATGDQLTIHAQDATGTTSTGGDIHIYSGNGTTDCGMVFISSGSQPVSTTRARTIVFYDESVSDEVWVGGTGPGAAYTRAVNTNLDASSQVRAIIAGSTKLSVLATAVSVVPPILQFTTAVASPVFMQQDDTTNAITGDTLTIHAQDTTGSNSTGGDLVLRAGTGTGHNGTLELQDGYGTPIISVTPDGDIILDPLTELSIDGGISATTYIAVGTNPAQSDVIRIPYNSAIMHRNSGNTADRQLIGVSGTSLRIGETSPNGESLLQLLAQSTIQLVATGGVRLAVTSTQIQISGGVNDFAFNSSSTAPVIRQLDQTVNGTNGANMTIHAQDTTGTGTKSGGNLTIRAGSASNGGVVGTDTGGDLILQAGAGDDIPGVLYINSGDGNYRMAVSTQTVQFDADIRFDDALVTPLIIQNDETSSTSSDLLTVQAQTNTVNGGTGGNLFLTAGNGTHVTAGSGGHIFLDGGTSSGTGVAGNIGMCTGTTVSSWQSMEKGIFIGDVTTAPTGDPSSGIFMWSESGALKARGSGGTVTTMAAAEPECPKCGLDYVIEARNDRIGWHKIMCLNCLVNTLNEHGIDEADYMMINKG